MKNVLYKFNGPAKAQIKKKAESLLQRVASPKFMNYQTQKITPSKVEEKFLSTFASN